MNAASSHHYIDNVLKDKGVRLTVATLVFFIVLSLISSNGAFFLVSLAYCAIVCRITGGMLEGALLTLVVTLALGKGQAVSVLMVPKELVVLFARRDVQYFFPLPISDFYLGVALWMSVRREGMFGLFRHASPAEVAFVAFLFIATIPAAGALHGDVASLSVIQGIKLFVMYLIWKSVKNAEFIRNAALALAALVGFEGVWSIAQVLARGPLGRYLESVNTLYAYGKTAWENPELLRIQGTFVDPDVFGVFMYMHAVFFLGLLLYFQYKTRTEKWLYAGAAVMAAGTLFFTGNRILYILSTATYMFLFWRTHSVHRVLKFIRRPLVFGVIIAALSVIVPFIVVRLENLPVVFSRYGSATFRIQMIQYSLRVALANPFGVGLGASPYYFATKFPGEKPIFGPDYPHSLLLQLVIETGVAGAVAFVTFLVWGIRKGMSGVNRFATLPYALPVTAYCAASLFYPIFLPLTELIGYVFIYLGLIASMNVHAVPKKITHEKN